MTRQRKFGALSTQKMDMRKTLDSAGEGAALDGGFDQPPLTERDVASVVEEAPAMGAEPLGLSSVVVDPVVVEPVADDAVTALPVVVPVADDAVVRSRPSSGPQRVSARVEPEPVEVVLSEDSGAEEHGVERRRVEERAGETVKRETENELETVRGDATDVASDSRLLAASAITRSDEVDPSSGPPVERAAALPRRDETAAAESREPARRRGGEAVKGSEQRGSLGSRSEDVLWREVVIAPQAVPTSVRYSMYLDEDVYEAADRDRIDRGIPTWREYFIALLAAHAHELDELFPSVGYDLSAFGIGVVSRRGYRRHDGRTRSISVSLPRGEQGMRIAELIETYAARAASKSAFAQVLVEHHLGVLRR